MVEGASAAHAAAAALAAGRTAVCMEVVLWLQYHSQSRDEGHGPHTMYHCISSRLLLQC